MKLLVFLAFLALTAAQCTDDTFTIDEASLPFTDTNDVCEPPNQNTYVVTLNSGTQVTVTLDYSGSETLKLIYRDEANSKITEISGAGEISVETTYTGEHNFIVKGASGSSGSDYTITIETGDAPAECSPNVVASIDDSDFTYTNTGEICASDDQDTYEVTLTEGAGVKVTVEFDNASGNLKLDYRDEQNERVTQSATSNDIEEIELAVGYTGVHYFIVKGQGSPSGQNTYTITITESTTVGCVESVDAEIEIDDIRGGNDFTASGEICDGNDVDEYILTAGAGFRIKVLIEFRHNQGNLKLQYRNEAGNLLEVSKTGDDDEELEFTTAYNGEHRFQVRPQGGGENTYDITISTMGSITSSETTVPTTTAAPTFPSTPSRPTTTTPDFTCDAEFPTGLDFELTRRIRDSTCHHQYSFPTPWDLRVRAYLWVDTQGCQVNNLKLTAFDDNWNKIADSKTCGGEWVDFVGNTGISHLDVTGELGSLIDGTQYTIKAWSCDKREAYVQSLDFTNNGFLCDKRDKDTHFANVAASTIVCATLSSPDIDQLKLVVRNSAGTKLAQDVTPDMGLLQVQIISGSAAEDHSFVVKALRDSNAQNVHYTLTVAAGAC